MKYESLKRIIAWLLSYRPEWLQDLELAADILKYHRNPQDLWETATQNLERRRANAAGHLSRVKVLEERWLFGRRLFISWWAAVPDKLKGK